MKKLWLNVLALLTLSVLLACNVLAEGIQELSESDVFQEDSLSEDEEIISGPVEEYVEEATDFGDTGLYSDVEMDYCITPVPTCTIPADCVVVSEAVYADSISDNYELISGSNEKANATSISLDKKYAAQLSGSETTYFRFTTPNQKAYYDFYTKNVNIPTHSWARDMAVQFYLQNSIGESKVHLHNIENDDSWSNLQLEPSTTYYIAVRNDWVDSSSPDGYFVFFINCYRDTVGDSIQSAKPISLNEENEVYSATMDGWADKDFFCFTTTDDTQYTFFGENINILTHSWSNEYMLQMGIYNEIGELLYDLRLGKGESDEIKIELSQNKNYYIMVYNPYSLKIASYDEEDTKGKYCFSISPAAKVTPTPHVHTPVDIPGVPATCTATGLTKGSKCSECGEVLTAQQVVPAKGHSPVTDVGYPATCTAKGMTEGSHCAVCGMVLTAQQVVPAKGHAPVTDPGYAPTCAAEGRTDGSHCAVCGKTLEAQQPIAVLPHTPVVDPGYAPTCAAEGRTDGSHCAVCGTVLTWGQPIVALPHTPVADYGYAPTYTTAGLTDGNHCAVCGAVLVPQQAIPALGYPQIAVDALKNKNAVTLSVGEIRQIVPNFATGQGLTVSGYKSSKPAVASVDANGLVTATAEGKVKITVTTNNKKVKATITIQVVDPYKPTGIGIVQGKAITLTMGQPVQLYAALAPATARATLTWTSNKAKVATVDANGWVVPQGEGKAKITVTTHNKKKATIAVTVVDPNKPLGIGISQGKAITLKVGEGVQLWPVMNPATAQSALTWKSGKAAVAAVDANGYVAALKKGKAKITVTTYNKKKATITVNVVE